MSTGHASADRSVAYIIGTYPLLTTTFIDREIDLLRRHGLDITVTALRRPHGPLSPDQRDMVEDVRYILPVSATALLRSHVSWLVRRPIVYWRTLARLVTRPHPTLRSRLKTVLHFGEGVHVAHLLRSDPRCAHLHAHFVDRATTVALVAGRLLDLSFSATAHANDIYVAPVLLAEKLTRARFVVTCTEYNAAHLSSVAGDGTRREILCIHHGLDLDRYAPESPSGATSDVTEQAAGDRSADARPVILAVGQLREKKGFRHLIDACRVLRDRGHDVECRIVGEGPLRPALEAQISALALDDTVKLCGALPHDDVVRQYRTATVFALPCVTGEDGDRDGIPNVILEAMAMRLPVVSTRHSGIPEAVVDGSTGLLVAPGDATALADALARLLDDPGMGRAMGRAGRHVVAEKFDVAANAKQLLRHFTTEPP